MLVKRFSKLKSSLIRKKCMKVYMEGFCSQIFKIGNLKKCNDEIFGKKYY